MSKVLHTSRYYRPVLVIATFVGPFGLVKIAPVGGFLSRKNTLPPPGTDNKEDHGTTKHNKSMSGRSLNPDVEPGGQYHLP